MESNFNFSKLICSKGDSFIGLDPHECRERVDLSHTDFPIAVCVPWTVDIHIINSPINSNASDMPLRQTFNGNGLDLLTATSRTMYNMITNAITLQQNQ